MEWHSLSDKVPQTIEDLIQILAENRGITDLDEFLSPTHPLELTLEQVGIDKQQMLKALEILETARETKQPIIVFGDYDADGISATTILWQTLHQLGFDAKPFIPHREKHGYGVSAAAIADMKEQGWLEVKDGVAPVLITVDNGIVAHKPIAKLVKLGMTVIITDHHVAEKKLPPAAAVVHTTKLCGATVSWMLSREIMATFGKLVTDQWWQLDVAGLATIADQVPLLDANRSFAWWGIKALRQTTRPGITAILTQATVEQSTIDENTVNYVLAPRINAMGRLSHGLEALRLLCTTTKARAEQIATKINDINTQRQKLTEDLVRIALSQQAQWADKNLIVVSSPAYHEGVIGLVAGKLAEQFHKPAIVIAVGEKSAKGSARSVPGVDMIAFLRKHRELFTELGGHPMAAGFGVEVERVEEVKTELEEADDTFANYTTVATSVDLVLPEHFFSLEVAEALQQLRPHGSANQLPLFMAEKYQIIDLVAIGKEKKHLKLQVKKNTDQMLEVLFWNQSANSLLMAKQDNITFTVSLLTSSWRNKVQLQLTAQVVTVEGDQAAEY